MRIVTAVLLVLSLSVFAQSEGDVVVTEVMNNPSFVGDQFGEWFELFNNTGSAIDIDGWRLRDLDAPVQLDTIDNGGSLLIPAGGLIVLANTGDVNTNGGVTVVDYVFDGFAFRLGNGDDQIILERPDGFGGWVVIDSVGWDDGVSFPDPNGASMTLTGFPNNNQNGFNWTTSSAREGDFDGVGTDNGSPGIFGVDQSDASLPVELTAFRLSTVDGNVVIRWTTSSEVNNLGFEILRTDIENGTYSVVADYRSDDALVGQFTTNDETDYRWVDKFVITGKTYSYKIADVDVNGTRGVHGPRTITPQIDDDEIVSISSGVPEEFKLDQNYPNPFNPTTRLKFDIPSVREGLSPVTVEIYNTLGQKIKTLFSGEVNPGVYEIDWDATTEAGNKVPAGVYIAIMKSRQIQQTIKMTLLK